MRGPRGSEGAAAGRWGQARVREREREERADRAGRRSSIRRSRLDEGVGRAGGPSGLAWAGAARREWAVGDLAQKAF